MIRFLWLSLIVGGLDQATKSLAERLLDPYQPVALAPLLNFVALTLVVSAVLIGWLWRLKAHERWLAWGLSLVIGGALGNLIDRLLTGRVVDFIDVYYERWHWPAFNVADSAITVGVVLLLIDGLWLARHRSART
mgnify:CR=1 FL=1